MQTSMTEEVPRTTSDHLVSVPGSEWAFWRWVCLRSAGFPAEGMRKLAGSPELLAAADEEMAAEQALERARSNAAQEINAALDSLRASGRWDDKPARKALMNARTAVYENKVPRTLPEGIRPESVAEIEVSQRRLAAARVRLNEEYLKSSAQTTESIREIARLPEFREALIWQNRSAARRVLDRLIDADADDPTRSSKQRQSEELIAGYWQRYCVKNDTIGFFGPVGWARFSPEDGHLRLRHGDRLVSVRTTYWEAWAMEALGAVIARMPGAQQWIAPILMPFIRVEGMVLSHPVFDSMRISARQAAMLQACDGVATAKQIAGKLLKSPGLRYQSEAEVYKELRELATKGSIVWNFNIPLGPHPEEVLRTALQRIEDPDLRSRVLGRLRDLESARAQIESSAGDADKLDRAFENLEQAFTRLTGVPAIRNEGKVYAGRTLVYEDCRRDVEVQLGADLLRPLEEPLSLLLATGRWFTAQVAEVYHRKLVDICAEITRATGKKAVDAPVCWRMAADIFFGGAAALIAPLQEEFRAKWGRALDLADSTAPVTFTCEQLRDRLAREFPASSPGWIAARYHSPDIMIAATDQEAIRKGDYFFVLGEVHVSVNTLSGSLFLSQHPSPQDLLDSVATDLGAWNVVPLTLSGTPGQDFTGSRTANLLVPKTNYRLEYLPNSFAIDRARALPVSSLVLENEQGTLVARSRDGRFRTKAIDLVGGLLSMQVIDCFRIMAPRRHAPRISVDRLVIQRESWRFSPSDLQFAQCADPADRFLQARKWAESEGLPRRAFFKVPVENKPAHVDFDSPILVDMFSKMVRRTRDANLQEAHVVLSEMLPAADQLWLADAQGRRYTSEFRMVAVDCVSK